MPSHSDLAIYQLMASVFLGIIGITFTVAQARGVRRQNTLALYERWDAPELSAYRSQAWDVWKNLRPDDDEVVILWLGGDFFGMATEEIARLIPESQTHAIRSLLNYFARIYEYEHLGLTDRRVTRELFREPWLWWGPFFVLLQGRVERHLRAKGLPEGDWAANSFITTLNRVVAIEKIIRRP